MSLSGSRIGEREQAELLRSAEEARQFTFTGVDQAQVERYLDPPAGTPYLLEYAFHLLGDVRGKAVIDLGCGKGENLIPLAQRGAKVTGIDVSPELIQLARERIRVADAAATATVGSAYELDFADRSVDVIFCAALIHHLDIPRARNEMWRVLKPGGFVVLSEPVRFSRLYDRVRGVFFPKRQDVSEFEHPLTRVELSAMCQGFAAEGQRYFRLPFVPLIERFVLRSSSPQALRASDASLRLFPWLTYFATVVVVKLQKTYY